MEKLTEVVIVSIFGRGNWLASELAMRGLNVTLVDVSERMGVWAPEDAGGPFGISESPDLTASQRTTLIGDCEMQSCERGLTIWLKEGPIECRSELTSFELRKRNVSSLAEEYSRKISTQVSLADPNQEREIANLRRLLERQPFEENWLAHWAHQLAANVYVENHRACSHGRALALFAPLTLRHLTRKSISQGLQACQASGVTIRRKANIRDVRITGRLIDAIEIDDERAGIERGRTFVWMLSGEETLRFDTPVHATLYPNGSMGPDWYWSRFQVELQGDGAAKTWLPPWVSLIEDPFLPWTHSNMMILKTTSRAGAYDVWLKLPVWARFDGKYLNHMRDEMLARLTERLPSLKPTLLSMPIESEMAREKLGCPRFPIYSEQSIGRTDALDAANVFFDGPERWSSLDPLGQLQSQSQIFTRILAIKEQWDAERRRAEILKEKTDAGTSA